MKLIDKAALVAELERRIKRFREEKDSVSIVKTNTYKGLLSFIDTLEVKEVDLDCNITGIKTKHAEGKLKECIESITEESLSNARKQLQKEPVSEDLNTAAKVYADNITDKVGYKLQLRRAVRFGANWQKEQFEKNRLAACDKQTEEEAEREQDFVMGIIENEHRQPTFNDAIKYGMKLQKEKMMAEAIDVEVKVDAGGYPYIDRTIELYDYDKDIPLAKEGDRYKVILIKEG